MRSWSTAPLLSGPGLLVQCVRSLTSSSRGQRWLLQGHCAELINGPSYVAAVCLMSLITTNHSSSPTCARFSLLFSHPPAILPQTVAGTLRNTASHTPTPVPFLQVCTVCLHISACVYTHLHTQKNREREGERGR